MAAQEIKVPDIGDFDAVEVIEVLVTAGDSVEEEQPLITLESDKATLEVPSSASGKITAVKISEGDKVAEGDVIALIEVAAADSDSADDTATEDTGAADTGAAADVEPAPAAATTASAGSQDIKVPDIGDFDAVEVIEVLVAAGDSVEEEQPLITLESDKATLEVPSSASGKITAVKVSEGDKVAEGDVIATLTVTATSDASARAPQPDAAPQATPEPAPAASATPDAAPAPITAGPQQGRQTQAPAGSQLTPVNEKAFSKAHAAPGVRKYARELGVDLGQVTGTGRKQRILAADINAYVKATVKAATSGSMAGSAGGGVPAQPDIDFSQFGEIETVELARIRKLSAKAVHKNWLLIPHVTQFDSADITDMEAFRQANKERAAQQGFKLTPLAFMLKACAAALKAFPDLNSSLAADGEHLIHKHYCHIAVAVDTDAGLMMPVLRDVDKKGIFQLAEELGDISSRARAGKLKAAEMQGACFSISSLGGVGGTAFTPIVNSPEVAILGVSRSTMQPVWQNGEFVPRLMLPLSLSYDHRVIDGAKAARITNFLSRALGDLRTLLL